MSEKEGMERLYYRAIGFLLSLYDAIVLTRENEEVRQKMQEKGFVWRGNALVYVEDDKEDLVIFYQPHRLDTVEVASIFLLERFCQEVTKIFEQ